MGFFFLELLNKNCCSVYLSSVLCVFVSIIARQPPNRALDMQVIMIMRLAPYPSCSSSSSLLFFSFLSLFFLFLSLFHFLFFFSFLLFLYWTVPEPKPRKCISRVCLGWICFIIVYIQSTLRLDETQTIKQVPRDCCLMNCLFIVLCECMTLYLYTMVFTFLNPGLMFFIHSQTWDILIGLPIILFTPISNKLSLFRVFYFFIFIFFFEKRGQHLLWTRSTDGGV